MPKYKVAAPDGRIVMLTGDSAPTEADLDEIFSSLPAQKQQPKTTTLDDANKLLEQTARGIPVIGGAYDALTAAEDATADYVIDKIVGKKRQNADGTPMTWRDRYNANMAKREAEANAFEQANPVQSLGASLVGGLALPAGAATKGATFADKVAEAAKVGIPLGALDMGVRRNGSLGDRLEASAQGGAMGAVLAPVAGAGSWAVGKGANKIVQAIEKRGARKLAEALQQGTTRGQEIYLGKLDDNILNNVNAIREISKVARLDNGHVYVPDAVVRHLKERRLVGDNYTPDQVIKAVSALFNKDSKVFAGKYPHIQAVVDATQAPANISFVGKNNTNGKTMLKTAYQGDSRDWLNGNHQRGAIPTSGGVDNTIYPQSPVVNQNLTRDETRVLERAVGGRDNLDNLLYNARKNNMSLVETGNEGVNRALMQAEQASPAARNTISAYQETRNSELPQQINNAMDVLLGKKKGSSSIEAMQAEFQQAAQPYYESAFQSKVPADKLVKLNQNKILKNTANKVDKDYANVFGGRKEVKVDDLEYWDGVKRKLDNDIAKEINSAAPDGSKIRNLEEARSELITALDEVNPSYREARNISSNKFEVEEAYKLSDKVFRADMTPDKFKSQMGKMSKPQVEAMKIGLRDKIANMLGARLDETSSFGKLLPKNAQENIRAIMGKDDGDKLIEFAQRIYNTNKALYSAKGNSLTAIRETLADEAMGVAGDLSKVNSVSKAVTLPLRWIGNAAVRKQNNKTFNNVANALLNNARGITLSDSIGRRFNIKANAATNAVLRALANSGNIAPVIQNLPARATGTTNDRLLKALGY